MTARTRISEGRMVVAPILGGASAIAGELAWLHARAVEAAGLLCGQAATPHCGWCVTAGGLAFVAVAVAARLDQRLAAPAVARFK